MFVPEGSNDCCVLFKERRIHQGSAGPGELTFCSQCQTTSVAGCQERVILILAVCWVRASPLPARALGLPELMALALKPPCAPSLGERSSLIAAAHPAARCWPEDSFWEHAKLNPSRQRILVSDCGKGPGQALCPTTSSRLRDMSEDRPRCRENFCQGRTRQPSPRPFRGVAVAGVLPLLRATAWMCPIGAVCHCQTTNQAKV